MRTDSTVALSYIQQLRGGRKKHLTKALHAVHHLCRKRKLNIMGQWISTEENPTADYWSRRPQYHQDYQCNPALIQVGSSTDVHCGSPVVLCVVC